MNRTRSISTLDLPVGLCFSIGRRQHAQIGHKVAYMLILFKCSHGAKGKRQEQYHLKAAGWNGIHGPACAASVPFLLLMFSLTTRRWLILALAIWAQVSDALYFYLERAEKKCFLEELPKETMVTGTTISLFRVTMSLTLYSRYLQGWTVFDCTEPMDCQSWSTYSNNSRGKYIHVMYQLEC